MGAAGAVAGTIGLQATAAERAARAQRGVARRQLSQAQRTQDRALAQAESPQELAALEQALERQRRDIAKQEELVQSLDPALLEAGQQLTQLLRGEEAQALEPVRQARQRQRQRIRDRLREQFGPGAEATSIGQQALSEFDFQTSQVLAQQQQQSLGQLFDISRTGIGAVGAERRAGVGALASIGSQFGNVAARRVGALTGTQPAVSQGFRAAQQTAGAGQVAESIIGGQLTELGSQALGAAIGSGGGGAAAGG